MKYLTYYLTALAVCVAVDFVWLSTTTSRLYQPVMGDMLAAKPALTAAAAFYLLYAAGVTIFCSVAQPVTAAKQNRPRVARMRTFTSVSPVNV